MFRVFPSLALVNSYSSNHSKIIPLELLLTISLLWVCPKPINPLTLGGNKRSYILKQTCNYKL